MGFFTDIIRYSKKPVGRTATKSVVRMTPAATVSPPGRSDPQEPGTSWNNSLSPIEESPQTFWEEEVGQSGAARAKAQPSELEDRQVVGPSPLENTEISDLAKAPKYKRSSPDIGKRKQAGLNNRRDVTVQSRMNRDQNLHGVVSFDKESYSSKGSSVVKPESKRPEQSARGKSVEVTHRSRQAGHTTRAGTTTPPIPITPDGMASTPARSAPKSVEKTSAPEDDRVSSSKIATPSEADVPKTDAFQAKRLESQGKRRDLPAAEETVDAGQRTIERSAPQRAAIAAGEENGSVQNPIEVSFPDDQAPEPFQADPHEKSPSQAVNRPPVHEPGGPKVHIGLLEVVVLAPENAAGRKTSRSPEERNFTSRHYLRNL